MCWILRAYREHRWSVIASTVRFPQGREAATCFSSARIVHMACCRSLFECEATHLPWLTLLPAYQRCPPTVCRLALAQPFLTRRSGCLCTFINSAIFRPYRGYSPRLSAACGLPRLFCSISDSIACCSVSLSPQFGIGFIAVRASGWCTANAAPHTQG